MTDINDATARNVPLEQWAEHSTLPATVSKGRCIEVFNAVANKLEQVQEKISTKALNELKKKCEQYFKRAAADVTGTSDEQRNLKTLFDKIAQKIEQIHKKAGAKRHH